MTDLLARIKISTKIVSLLLLLGVVVLAVAILGATSLGNMSNQYSVLVDTKLPVTTKMARVNQRATQMAYAGYRAMAYPGGSAQGKASIAVEQKAFETASQLLRESQAIDPSLADTVRDIQEQIDAIHESASKAIKLGVADQNDAARATLADLDAKVDSLATSLSQANDLRIKEGKELSDTLDKNAGSASMTMLVVSVLGIVLGAGIALFVARIGLSTPIARLQDTMGKLAAGNTDLDVPGTNRADEIGAMAKAVLIFRDNAKGQALAQAEKAHAEAEQKRVVESLEGGLSAVAQGDLTADIQEDFSPAYAAVKANFNEALGSLRQLIGAVSESAQTIRTGSGEIAQASEDLARRTEANAASLEETSAAVSQMDGRLRATAEAAGRTVERADGAISSVSDGRSIADEAMQAMTRVNESAKGIDSVIEGLDKIAFQTRVLAMNAAVEAGRAGEAGRGFAVVADLVSALAMRAEEEAGRARDQLTATQTDIVAAVGMVQKVDSALANISGDVSEVHTLLEQMASDNQAQSTAISQISVAIGTMDQSTQQNAAMVEETSAAARNLNGEVAALSEQAGKFNVGHGARVTTARSMGNAPAKPRAAGGYVSPVKAMSVPVANGANGAASGDWATF